MGREQVGRNRDGNWKLEGQVNVKMCGTAKMGGNVAKWESWKGGRKNFEARRGGTIV